MQTVYRFTSNIKSLNRNQTYLAVIHANRSVVCALVSLNINQVSPYNTPVFSLQSVVGRSSFTLTDSRAAQCWNISELKWTD